MLKWPKRSEAMGKDNANPHSPTWAELLRENEAAFRKLMKEREKRRRLMAMG